MQRSFGELCPKDKYTFMATVGIIYGDGWFVDLTAYVRNSKEASRKIILVYTSGITADSTIDSSLYDSSMTHAFSKLLLVRNGKKVSKWLWEKDGGAYFRRLSEREFIDCRKKLMQSVKQTELPREKIRSVTRPRVGIFHWRSRND